MFTFHNDLLHKRIRSCVAYGALLGIIDYALFLIDYAVSGRSLGEQAMAGITMVNPLITFLTFVSILIPSGSLAAIAYVKGKKDADDANRLFGQGVFISVILGAFFSVITYILASNYYEHIHISEEVSDYASQYCLGLVFMPLFMFLNTFLYFIPFYTFFQVEDSNLTYNHTPICVDTININLTKTFYQAYILSIFPISQQLSYSISQKCFSFFIKLSEILIFQRNIFRNYCLLSKYRLLLAVHIIIIINKLHVTFTFITSTLKQL